MAASAPCSSETLSQPELYFRSSCYQTQTIPDLLAKNYYSNYNNNSNYYRNKYNYFSIDFKYSFHNSVILLCALVILLFL